MEGQGEGEGTSEVCELAAESACKLDCVNILYFRLGGYNGSMFGGSCLGVQRFDVWGFMDSGRALQMCVSPLGVARLCFCHHTSMDRARSGTIHLG